MGPPVLLFILANKETSMLWQARETLFNEWQTNQNVQDKHLKYINMYLYFLLLKIIENMQGAYYYQPKKRLP